MVLFFQIYFHIETFRNLLKLNRMLKSSKKSIGVMIFHSHSLSASLWIVVKQTTYCVFDFPVSWCCYLCKRDVYNVTVFISIEIVDCLNDSGWFLLLWIIGLVAFFSCKGSRVDNQTLNKAFSQSTIPKRRFSQILQSYTFWKPRKDEKVSKRNVKEPKTA